MTRIPPISHRASLADEVYERLVEAVCSGRFPPGEVLRQEKLAEDLDVSRQPIIQALGVLRRDGLIEPAGKRGYRVAPVDAALVRHVYQLRAAFDGLAARLAAERSSPDIAARLDGALADGNVAARCGDIASLVDSDVAFHATLYEISGNPMLFDAAAPIWRQVRRVMVAVLERSHTAATVWAEHAAIADAVKRGDPDAAENLAKAHATHAADRLIAAMPITDTRETKKNDRKGDPNET